VRKDKFFRTTLLIFLIGLLIRLLVMPFAMQADLLSMYFRASLMTENGLWGLATNQYWGHLIYALNLLLMKLIAMIFGFFSSDFRQIFPDPTSFGINTNSLTSSVGDWLNFVGQEKINSFIFFLKIPHLLADIAIFCLLFKIFKKDKKRNLILALWFFNPVNIYAFYVFSRHDSLTALALLLAVFFLAKEKIISLVLSIFAAIKIRFQPLFYLPFFLIHWLKNFKNKQKHLNKYALATLIVLLLIFIEKKLPFDQTLNQNLRNLTVIENTTTSPGLISKIFNLATSVGGRTTSKKLIFFIFVYAALNLFYLFIKKAKSFKEAFLNLNLIAYLSLALYFVFNDFSPHYFVWLSLFASVSSLINKKFIYFYLLSILGWGIMGLMDTGNFAINQNLFLPVSKQLFNTPQIGYSLSFAPQLYTLGKILLNISLLLSSYQVIIYFLPQIDKKLNFKKIFLPILLTSLIILKTPGHVKAAKYPVAEIKTESYLQQGDDLIAFPKIELLPGMIYRKTFVSPVASFAAIDFKFDTSRSTADKRLAFRIKKEGAEDWHFENIYSVKDFYNKAYYPFGFSPLINVEGEKILIEMELLDESDLALYFYQDDFILSEERSSRELLGLIKTDFQNKIQTQKTFFIFWAALLISNLGAVILLLFANQKKPD